MRFLVPAFFLLIASGLTAQNTAVLKKNGEKAFSNQRWEEALSNLEQYQEAKPGDPSVLLQLGICHYNLHHADKARSYFEYLAARTPGKASPDTYYYLARTLHGQAAFEQAAEAYKQFLRVTDGGHPLRANARDNIRRCLSGMDALPNEQVALVENFGKDVNSAGDEFAPLPSVNYKDRLYYAAARPGCNGGRRNDAGYEDTLTGHWCADMFYADYSLSGWRQAGDLGALINSPRNEVALAFGNGGKVLYYFRGFTLYGGSILADTATAKDEYALEPPAFNSPVRGEDGDGDLYFFNDTTMMFASRRAGGFGGYDLYFTRLHQGLWTEPVNLGPTVNSAYDERTPFLSRDGRTLFFSSNRTESIGGLDVFRAVYDDKQLEWSAPQNFGMPVNSPGDDASFRLSADGLSGFLASDRMDGYGMRDLYAVYFKSEQTEQLAASRPAFFADAAAAGAAPGALPSEIALPALYYTDDRDLLRAENQTLLATVIDAYRKAPGSMLVVTVHTDESGPVKFDLYYGIKRAEALSKALTDAGVPAANIVLKSAGPNFPAARTVVGAEAYPAGAASNRRAEFRLADVNGRLPFRVQTLRQEVPAAAVSDGARQYDDWQSGLAFKVEVVAARQVITTDALAMFDNTLVETTPGEGVYHYTVGYSRKFEEAAKLRQEARNAGFADATVVAYIDGLRIGKAEAVSLLKKYPELAGFIKS